MPSSLVLGSSAIPSPQSFPAAAGVESKLVKPLPLTSYNHGCYYGCYYGFMAIRCLLLWHYDNYGGQKCTSGLKICDVQGRSWHVFTCWRRTLNIDKLRGSGQGSTGGSGTRKSMGDWQIMADRYRSCTDWCWLMLINVDCWHVYTCVDLCYNCVTIVYLHVYSKYSK
jgi:hypothetical protein